MSRIVCLMMALSLVAGCRTTLHGGLQEAEANEILLALAEEGIDAGKSKESSGTEATFSVVVDNEDQARAWQALGARGLPRPRHAGFRQVYSERALVPGRMEERALFLSALQAEIAATLEAVDGVVCARVHVTGDAASRHPSSSDPPPTASVLIVFRPAAEGKPPIGAEKVGKVVANAVVGLDPARVAVIFTPCRKTAGRIEPPGAGSPSRFKIAAGGVIGIVLLAGLLIIFRRYRHHFVPGRRAGSGQ